MKINFATIRQKSSNLITDFREYWTKPPKDKYISYKEIGAYSLGGVGKMLIGMLTAYIGLGATNTLVGSVIGLRPLDLQTMNIVLGFLGAAFTVIRGVLVDNTKTRWGRFRPYIAIMGVPMVALMAIFVFLPFELMDYSVKLFWTFLFAVALTLISPLLNDTYTDLRTVMSPNTQERSLLIAVSSIIASAAPTITNLFIPYLAQNVLGGYTNIRVYRALFVPIGIIGLFFVLFTAFGTKERIFVSKQFKPKIRTLYAMGQLYRNKYWWIRMIAGWTAFLEGGIASLFGWIFYYQIQNGVVQTIVITVTGLASTVAMLSTPAIIKKIGPRNLMIYQNFLNIVFLSLMAISFKWSIAGIPAFFFAFNFLSTVVYEFNIVGDPVIHAEVKDFSHYQTGRRMDFMFGTAGIIGLPLTMLTGYVIPLIYESAGLTNNYDVLFDPAVRNGLFTTLCVVSVIGSAINLVPYLFYDLSESQHRNIIKVLRVRNLFENYIGNDLSPHDIKTSIEDIREARVLIDKEKIDTAFLKTKLKNAKTAIASTNEQKAEKKESIKKARKEYYDAKTFNENVDAAHLVINDLKKYETAGFDFEKLRLARETVGWGFDGIKKLDEKILTDAKSIKKGKTDDERRLKHYMIRRAKLLLKLKKAINEQNLVEMDTSELQTAQNMPETNREEILKKFKAVNAEQKKLNKYSLDAEAYEHLNSIEAMYADACRQVEEIDRANEEKREAAKKAKQEDLERIRNERRAKRENKGGK
ncbi:MAG: MFS transporter [Clostridiales bacterium]|jgi:Na+/melibiose symporter-like transporter|nr:MFS transporter [Clostridiales bacterium]